VQDHLLPSWVPPRLPGPHLLRLLANTPELLSRSQSVARVRGCGSYSTSAKATVYEVMVAEPHERPGDLHDTGDGIGSREMIIGR